MTVSKRFFRLSASIICANLLANPVWADPVLFAPDTGFRVAKYRAPVPESPPGIAAIEVEDVATQNPQDTVLIDVRPVQIFEINDDGSWIIPEPIKTIPGSVWLPGIGVGEITAWAEDYMTNSLRQIAKADQTVIVFCRVDCWHSWNAVQRVAALGYTTRWFDGGVEVWEDTGRALEATTPWPVPQ